MDRCRLTGIVFLDLKKAFDTVDHNLLLSKLSAYAISDSALFAIYLQDRLQSVCIGNNISKPASIQLGVPQGSILGPQLFTLFVNDLPNSVTIGQVIMYADDTTIMYSSTNSAEIETGLNADLDRVSVWLKRNRLILNTTKTKYVSRD